MLAVRFPLLAVLVLAPLAIHAQVTIPQPVLTTISPPVAKAGTTVDVTLTGTDLDGASSLLFSAPGITCAPKLDDKQKPIANKFTVTLPPSAASAICDARIAARYGVSNPRAFMITALPVVNVPATATSIATAFKAALNTTLTGTAVKQASLFISFDAKKGQRIIAACQPLLLDSRLDAAISLRNQEGRKLARLEPDGLLDFTAPTDGTFMIELGDLMYRGDAEYAFALTLTTGPVIEYAFDNGAQWTLYGRNLPKGQKAATRFNAELQRAQLPADEAKKLLASNPINAIRFGSENDSPDKPAPSVALKTPARYTGWFAPRGQARVFTFDAKKGDVLWIEASSARKGLNADPYFVVEKGDAFIAEANDTATYSSKGEFDAGAADPSYRFEAKEDGTYRVKLRNLASSGAQEPFELTIRPVGNDAALIAIPSTLPKGKATNVDMTSAPLWRGGVAVLKVFALRKGGFNGAIELAADGLPADVKFLGGVIREGQATGYAAFYAEENAKDWAGMVKLHGKTGAPARGATLQFKVANTAKESVLTRLTEDHALGVVPAEAPVLIEATTAAFDAPATGKLTIPLQVKRRGDCTDAIKLTSLGIDGLTADIAAKADKGSIELDVAKLKLPAGDHPLILQGTVKFKHKRGDDAKAAAKEMTFLVHSKPIIVRVKPAEPKAK